MVVVKRKEEDAKTVRTVRKTRARAQLELSLSLPFPPSIVDSLPMVTMKELFSIPAQLLWLMGKFDTER